VGGRTAASPGHCLYESRNQFSVRPSPLSSEVERRTFKAMQTSGGRGFDPHRGCESGVEAHSSRSALICSILDEESHRGISLNLCVHSCGLSLFLQASLPAHTYTTVEAAVNTSLSHEEN
jgi:hypothetical protein